MRRWRTALGLLVLLVGLAVYSLAAMAIGASLVPRHWLAELAYYLVAGLAWVWPAGQLVAWMVRSSEASLR